jgi:hypothetical protein
MLFGKTHRKHSHVAVGLNPLAMVLKHAIAWGSAMHAEGMAAYFAEEFGEDSL